MLYIDTSAWVVIEVTGADRNRFLGGMTTVNVETLTGLRFGAMLSPKGRVRSVLAMHQSETAIFLITEPSLGEKTLALLQAHAVMDDVAFAAQTHPSFRRISTPHDYWTAAFEPGTPPAPWASPEEAEAARLRAGFVRYGVDVDEDCFPFETPLAAFLDYQKGCYIGQEPVFRVHAQGNAARMLRVVQFDGAPQLAPGQVVSHASRSNAGTITSVVQHAGTTLALTYLHRTVWDPGGTVYVGEHAGTVHACVTPTA